MTSTSDIDTITHKHEKYSYFSPKGLTLSLLVLGVLADDHDLAFSLDDLALLADLLDGRFHFHW